MSGPQCRVGGVQGMEAWGKEGGHLSQLRTRASLMAGKQPMGSACAPPAGSGTISSITLNFTSSVAVMRSASVACPDRECV